MSFLEDRQKEGSIRKGKAPWGHPLQTAMRIVAPWTEIVATLSERKLFRIRRRCAGHERMANESIIVGCHNESKALFISRKAGVHFFSSSNASSTNYTIE
jgi:hypothetical protein